MLIGTGPTDANAPPSKYIEPSNNVKSTPRMPLSASLAVPAIKVTAVTNAVAGAVGCRPLTHHLTHTSADVTAGVGEERHRDVRIKVAVVGGRDVGGRQVLVTFELCICRHPGQNRL